MTERTIGFHYYHPLSDPMIEGNNGSLGMSEVRAKNVLYYGLLEQTFKVTCDCMVYDPQNHTPLRNSGSTVKALALVLNLKEALLISGLSGTTSLRRIAISLKHSQNAHVVVIKNGPRGAFVLDENNQTLEVPVFETTYVWPIGSGDIFTAVFTYFWMAKKKDAFASALKASRFAAHFCTSPTLPLPKKPDSFKALQTIKRTKSVYLAGPFFTLSERWLINELRAALYKLGNDVFSPLHDVGLVDTTDYYASSKEITTKDLTAIKNSDVVLAVLSGLDPGTIFEIGFAKQLDKRVIIFSENISDEDMTLFVGSNCFVTDDFSTAVYKASW